MLIIWLFFKAWATLTKTYSNRKIYKLNSHFSRNAGELRRGEKCRACKRNPRKLWSRRRWEKKTILLYFNKNIFSTNPRPVIVGEPHGSNLNEVPPPNNLRQLWVVVVYKICCPPFQILIKFRTSTFFFSSHCFCSIHPPHFKKLIKKSWFIRGGGASHSNPVLGAHLNSLSPGSAGLFNTHFNTDKLCFSFPDWWNNILLILNFQTPTRMRSRPRSSLTKFYYLRPWLSKWSMKIAWPATQLWWHTHGPGGVPLPPSL